MTSTAKLVIQFFIVFFAGLLAGASLAHFGIKGLASSYDNKKIEQNTDIISILDEEIMSLTYRTGALTLTAQRSRPADRFAVQVTFSNGRTPQQCMSSPDLAGQLAGFSTITAKRRVQAGQVKTEFPIQLGTLEIKDRMVGEVLPSMALRTNANRTAVAVSYDGNVAEISTRINAFTKLEAGCDTLAQH